MMDVSTYNTTIIGGCGHVGLPLGVVLASKGIKVKLLDINQNSVNLVNRGEVPFYEPGIKGLLVSALISGNIEATTNPEVISDNEYLIFVTGTPLNGEFNPQVDSVIQVINQYKNYFNSQHKIILRSTVYPGTTSMVTSLLSTINENVYFCPERIAEGQAIKELQSLPQLIGSKKHQDVKVIEDFFSILGIQTIVTSYENAEIIKLLTNTWRYIKFGVVNEMWLLCQQIGIDFNEIRELMIRDYPRTQDLPKSGFAGGPCLIKDSRQLSHFFENKFMFANTALQINNSIPIALANIIFNRFNTKEITIGILGMAFKKDSDDTRSSLAYQLKEILETKTKQVLTSDPFIKTDKKLVDKNYLISESEIIIIGAPHSEYENLKFNKPVFNIW
jgi:UDP-N-acetyl-D-mannosaminuronic acid dehydrogenase